MPYPFAHPAAVLHDLWYFAPFVSRADSHSVAGLFWFCLPAGFLAYALFHRCAARRWQRTRFQGFRGFV